MVASSKPSVPRWLRESGDVIATRADLSNACLPGALYDETPRLRDDLPQAFRNNAGMVDASRMDEAKVSAALDDIVNLRRLIWTDIYWETHPFVAPGSR